VRHLSTTVLMLTIALSAVGCESATNSITERSSPTTAVSSFVPPTTPDFTLPPQVAPDPIVVKGQGAEVKKIELEADSPLVATGTHSGGSSNFIVELIPSGGEDSILLFNEIGSFKGQAAFDEISAGSYRLKVDADGAWKVTLEQPVPEGDEKDLERTFGGSGADVIRVQVLSEIQPTVHGKHTGEANFIVELIGYGDLSGSILVFNELGKFQGDTVTESLPAGTYLLNVQADGKWTLSFTP
jgi:hypothetical protein